MEKVKTELVIECRDSNELIYSRVIPAGSLSNKEIEQMLKRLACKYLSKDEIIDSSVRRNAKAYKPLLEIKPNRSGKFGFSVGENPYFTVRSREAG